MKHPCRDPNGLDRFRLLAGVLVGRSVEVAQAPAGTAAHTDGRVIFVRAGRSDAEQRRELLVQAALLGAGSLDPRVVKALRGRPSLARHYLALEGRRVLTELADRVPLAAELSFDTGVDTATADESLAMARRRRPVIDPPEWFGVIRPSRLLAPGARPTDRESRPEFDPLHVSVADDDGDAEQSGEGKSAKLFENPLFRSRTLRDLFRKQPGSARASGDGPIGAETPMRAVRRARRAGKQVGSLPTRISFIDGGKPGAVGGAGGTLYPEWDVHHDRYRPEWCRVIDSPCPANDDITDTGVPPDDVLRRRLARVGLGPRALRGRSAGDELDLEALIDLFVDLRSGYSPSENVYREHRKVARDLGVLILLDASGSATDADPDGRTVHGHQRRAAATLAVTLEELGDRVAVYAFRSHGRHAVHLHAITTFGQRFSAVGRTRLNQLRPSGYTRLGAGIRGAGEILKTRAGTQNRLLLLLSDGLPYDSGYEGHYAEADARKALEELRGDGVGCLCLSLGADTDSTALNRVFGSAGHADATTLAELSPHMDDLFLSCLRELGAPKPVRG
ncbi:nitric oxide reductase activation protein NorD [Nocardia sp. BMG51109]|uniref:nitric oxide reductase activation protein NorD n=1 Tax=Nocardia sp. BMG51109 TaxID=1056816 RepID=UPI0004641571|nr:VWA domain-containing protein [Nocardia sp. BMG51109]